MKHAGGMTIIAVRDHLCTTFHGLFVTRESKRRSRPSDGASSEQRFTGWILKSAVLSPEIRVVEERGASRCRLPLPVCNYLDRGSTAAAAVTSARRCGPKLSLLSVAKAEITTIERESLELVRWLDALSKTLFPIDNFFSANGTWSHCRHGLEAIRGNPTSAATNQHVLHDHFW